MINAEKYKKVLCELTNLHGSSIGKMDNRLMGCSDVLSCMVCEFETDNKLSCGYSFMKWLLSEAQ